MAKYFCYIYLGGVMSLVGIGGRFVGHSPCVVSQKAT